MYSVLHSILHACTVQHHALYHVRSHAIPFPLTKPTNATHKHIAREIKQIKKQRISNRNKMMTIALSLCLVLLVYQAMGQVFVSQVFVPSVAIIPAFGFGGGFRPHHHHRFHHLGKRLAHDTLREFCFQDNNKNKHEYKLLLTICLVLLAAHTHCSFQANESSIKCTMYVIVITGHFV